VRRPRGSQLLGQPMPQRTGQMKHSAFGIQMHL
jgi:hypothetical protein